MHLDHAQPCTMCTDAPPADLCDSYQLSGDKGEKIKFIKHERLSGAPHGSGVVRYRPEKGLAEKGLEWRAGRARQERKLLGSLVWLASPASQRPCATGTLLDSARRALEEPHSHFFD